ncbi:MAG: alpha/beta hydrolase, partial [Xanthomonadaceae bacterium]|nr:alpha/beta hydrolase [Xanthomonadaceae bacterium]
MKTSRGTIQAGRFEVPYRVYGQQENLLVCVSGAMQTMSIWRSVVKRFCGEYTVVLFDMPGVGRSRIVSGGAHVTVDEQIAVLDALIRQVRRRGELTLAGSSWGTAIAASYAAGHPEAVQCLLLSSFGMRPNAGMEYVVKRATELYQARDYAGGA